MCCGELPFDPHKLFIQVLEFLLTCPVVCPVPERLTVGPQACRDLEHILAELIAILKFETQDGIFHAAKGGSKLSMLRVFDASTDLLQILR
jgi:hypothetical protein